MSIELYKLRQGKILSGVLAGIAHKFSLEFWLVRIIFIATLFMGRLSFLSLLLYVLGSIYLPYKEDKDAERYGTGPRKIKEAEKIHKSWFK
ncbi:PspC domain-containing protein [Streptococcus suis]|nr:PspC domain-containing protein [Streptococcus suis]